MPRSRFPGGTVTFLFTDIEGSTRLIEELGEEGYVEALAEHRRLLRGAFSARGGVEVDTQGDAFLYVFRDAAEAVVAAAQGQRALSSGPVRVRMGVHTGKPLVTGEGYAGRELHRAARIAASAHGDPGGCLGVDAGTHRGVSVAATSEAPEARARQARSRDDRADPGTPARHLSSVCSDGSTGRPRSCRRGGLGLPE
jgi:class 3 adenylate cyclase